MKRLALEAALACSLIFGMPVSAKEPAELSQDTQQQINEEIRQGELQLLACLVYAEAGNQDLYGKRLVADTVLNRVDSPEYPGSISGVIYQSGQFSCVTDGGLDRAFFSVTDDCFKAVSMEIESRTDPQVMFFTAYGYGQYGEPYMQYGDHYFSR